MKLLALLAAAATLAVASPSIKAPKAVKPKPVANNQKPAPKASKPTSLVLLYTSCARGQIRACNCTKFQFGGYGRQLTLLRSIRSENQDVLMLEGGDSTAGDGFQAKLKAGVTSSALELLGYGAMVPGEQELGKSGIRYLDYFNPKSVPVICANVPDLCEKEPGYVPYVILKTKGNLKVGVIGLLDDSITQEMKRRGITLLVSDPVESLKSLIHNVRAKSDLIVVVYHGTPETAGRLAEVDGTDLVLCTHLTGRDFQLPNESTNEVTATVERSGSAYVVKGQTSTNWSLGRIDLTLSDSGKIKDATHRLFYLDRRYDEDHEMVKMYDDYNEKVTQAVLDESKKMKSNMEVLLVKRGAKLDEMRSRLHKSPFAGDGKCKECHTSIHETWSNSRHAHAIATLDKTNQGFDPECVSCHVTGAKVHNGYSNKKDTPELANVQCEACHGPGLEHTKSPASLYGAVGEETCRSCHTDERTPDFSYDEEWEKIKH